MKIIAKTIVSLYVTAILIGIAVIGVHVFVRLLA